MSDQKHSPAPWTMEVDDNEGRAMPSFNLRDANGKDIAWSCGDCHDAGDSPSAADARLIAAAPEMLAVLKMFVGRDLYTELIRNDGGPIECPACRRVELRVPDDGPGARIKCACCGFSGPLMTQEESCALDPRFKAAYALIKRIEEE